MSYEVLAGVALKGTAIAAAAWVVARCLRRWSAAARHLVWTAAMAALVALPVLSVAVPEWRLPEAVSVDAGVVFRAFGVAEADDAYSGLRPVRDLDLAHPKKNTAPVDVRQVLAVIWGVGSAIGLIEMLVAYARMWRVRRSARDARELAAGVGINCNAPVLETAVGMPATFGWLRPAVLLPEEAREWSDERRRMVLLHEFAHVRRSDAATHLFARAALCLYWWNPLIWLAWREFLKERERAADDLVLNAGARASDYAGHLLEIARTLRPAPASAAAAVAMARRSQLEGRLLMILDSNVNRKSAARVAPLAAVALAVALVAPFASVRAQDPVQREAPDDAAIRAAMAQKNHEILERAARIYQQQRKYEEAQTLLESALAIRGERSGQQSAAYAQGLIKLGDLAARRKQSKEAEAFYTKAVSLGDRPEVIPALLYLGMNSKDLDQAFLFFDRALRADYNGADAGRAIMWMGVTRQRQGRAAEAEAHFKDAVARQAPNTTAAGNIMEAYARFLDQDPARQAEASDLHARAQETWMARRAEGGAPPVSPAFRVGGGVTSPALLYKVEPDYSEEARALRQQGVVVLQMEIGTDGRAYNIRVVTPLGFGLDERAIEAIQQWKFKPGAKGGEPVTVAAAIEVNFRLL